VSDQYLRKWSLILTEGSKALDLSEMHIRFKVNQADNTAPNTASIRIYNLADSTAQAIQKEYQSVVLQAGYETGNFAVIFQGTIAQIVRGRESALDSFVEIHAADGDEAINFACVSKSSAAAATSNADRIKVATDAMKPYGVDVGNVDLGDAPETGGILPRGKVSFALASHQLDDVCASTATTWSVQGGKIVIIPLTGYLPGEAVVLSAQTGLIGIPEATVDGINVRCLLNPLIRIGGRVQIDNASINLTTVRQQFLYPNYSDANMIANPSSDGFYRVLVSEFTGDNRGNEWYSDLVCLAIDPSSVANKSVQAY